MFISCRPGAVNRTVHKYSACELCRLIYSDRVNHPSLEPTLELSSLLVYIPGVTWTRTHGWWVFYVRWVSWWSGKVSDILPFGLPPQARSGGGPVPLLPPSHAPSQEPEAGSNLINSKLTYIFTILINRQCHNLSILWLFLKFFLVS